MANYAVHSEELKSVLQATSRKTKSFRRAIFFSMPSNQSPHMAQYLGMHILNIRLSMMSFVKTCINYLK